MKVAGRELVPRGFWTRIGYGCPWWVILSQSLASLLIEVFAAGFLPLYCAVVPAAIFVFWFAVARVKLRLGRQVPTAIVYPEAFEKQDVWVRNRDGEVVERSYVRWETTIEGQKNWWGLDEGDRVYYRGILVFVAERPW